MQWGITALCVALLAAIIVPLFFSVRSVTAPNNRRVAVLKYIAEGEGYLTTSETSSRANKLSTAAEEMSANLNNVAAAMEQSSTNASMVATAAEEMTATINEIAQNAEKARSISDQAVLEAGEDHSLLVPFASSFALRNKRIFIMREYNPMFVF